MRTRRATAVVIAAAVLIAIGAVVAGAATGSGSWNSGWQMMGSRYVYRPAKTTPIHTLTAARAEAQRFADRLGLRVDEVLQFKRNFYAKLVDGNGNGATEVLVDPSTGVVATEYGPAMMWNTRYGMRNGGSMMGSYGRGMMGGGYSSGMMGGGYGAGMMGGGYGTPAYGQSSATNVSLSTAHVLAQRWLDRNESGVKVETGGDTFPGYYTLETLKGGQIMGMISVNARTGAVWPHWWHGAFVAKSE